MRRLVAILLFTVGLVGAAEAHALLKKAVPPVGGSVTLPPKEVVITFSEGVEPAFSTIEVTDSSGKRVDSGKAHATPDSHQTLAIDLTPIGPGSYKVVWHAVSVDTHKTEGSYGFTVGP